MSINGASNSSAKVDIAKNIGTGPTDIDKKFVKSITDGAKEVSKAVSTYVKTPEGKVNATGLLLSPVVLPVGMGLIFGPVAYSALKHLTENKEDNTPARSAEKAAATAAAIAGSSGGMAVKGFIQPQK